MDTEYLRKAREYGEKALTFCKTSGKKEFPTIRPGTMEWDQWRRYFLDHLGFEPWAMKRCRNYPNAVMTVPAQWPEWFDSSYVDKAA